MTLFEFLTLPAALIAALTGIASLIRNRRVDKKQLLFETTADIVVELIKQGTHDYKFVLSNRGGAPARDINFRIAEDSPDNPLVPNECAGKLPYPELAPGRSFTLIAALHMESAMTYLTHITWRNIDGSTGARDAYVST